MLGSDAGGVEETPLESVYRLEFEVPWPPGHVAAYLLDGDEPILIDAGPPADSAPDRLRSQLASVGLEIDDVAHVLVTHPHTDHSGQVPTLREAGASIYAPARVIDQLERDEGALDESARAAARGAGLTGDALERATEKAVDSLRRNRRLLRPTATHPIDRTDPFSIGGRRFEPIHTPGHHVHHCCYRTEIEGRRVLFAGDALIESFRPVIIHVGLDHGAYDGADAFYTALDRLDGVDATLAFPGHGPVFTDLEGVIENTRRDLDELVDETMDAVQDVGPATPLTVTESRTGGFEYPSQLLDTMAALGRLDRRGAVRYEPDDGVRRYRRE